MALPCMHVYVEGVQAGLPQERALFVDSQLKGFWSCDTQTSVLCRFSLCCPSSPTVQLSRQAV
eukprot:656086-Pelagomonas_calceolata.AAC.11